MTKKDLQQALPRFTQLVWRFGPLLEDDTRVALGRIGLAATAEPAGAGVPRPHAAAAMATEGSARAIA